MPAQEQLLRFTQMEQDGAQLRSRFKALTSAHGYFQAHGLKSISVSDELDDGGIEVVFMEVRIRFQMLMMFNDAFEPRGRVFCTHCHCLYGEPVQEKLGGFIFDTEGATDLDTCVEGQVVTLERSAPQIVLTFLERAMAANRGF